MKTLIYSAIIGISTALFSCETFDNQFDMVIPDEDVTVRQHEFYDFQELNIESAFTVYVNFSDTEEQVRIKANENLHEYIEIFKDGDELTIRVKRHINIRKQPTLIAYVTTANIHAYQVSGASRVILNDPLESVSVHLALSGASQFKGDVTCEELYSQATGASLLNLTGSTSLLEARLSGASNLEGSEFKCNQAYISLSGASRAEMTVNDELDISASGASVVKYRGGASIIHQSLSGESRIIKMD